MCGRFTQKSERKIIAEEFYVQQFLKEPEINYNVAPGQEAGIIIKQEDKNIYDRYKWGLIPHWAKEPPPSGKMINARAETVISKPSFKGSFISKRCIIPVDGFFEWKKEKNRSIPYYIFRKDGKPFALAGLWDVWINPDISNTTSEKIYTFTIITVDATQKLKSIHERMPAIIPKEIIDQWLDTSIKEAGYLKKLHELLFKQKEDNLDLYRVSTIVNSPTNNTPDCIKPVDELNLF